MNSQHFVYVLGWSGYEGNDAIYLLNQKKFSKRQFEKLVKQAYIRAFEGTPKAYVWRELFNLSKATSDIQRGFKDEHYEIEGEMRDYFSEVISELQKDGFSQITIECGFNISEMAHIVSNDRTHQTAMISKSIKTKYPQLKQWMKLPEVEIRSKEEEKYDFIWDDKPIEREMITETLGKCSKAESLHFYFVKLKDERYAKFDMQIRTNRTFKNSNGETETRYKIIPESFAKDLAEKILDWDKCQQSVQLA